MKITYTKKQTISAVASIAAFTLVALIQFTGCKSDTTAAVSYHKTVTVIFNTHLQAHLPEQDVFLQSKTAADSVVRADSALAAQNMTSAVFATTKATPHDPFQVGSKPLEPFAKGTALGFTMGDWLAATGSGTYTFDSTNANANSTLAFTFTKLRPNATYTVWCSRITLPPNPSVVDAPCGKADGSENVFHTDASGNGTYSVTLSTALPVTVGATHTIIAIAYHSDGVSHGASAGDFGLNSHIQIFSLFQ